MTDHSVPTSSTGETKLRKGLVFDLTVATMHTGAIVRKADHALVISKGPIRHFRPFRASRHRKMVVFLRLLD
jgi:hypothetical protein